MCQSQSNHFILVISRRCRQCYFQINSCMNEWSCIRPVCTYRLNWANLLRMLRWMKWHCPPDTEFDPWESEAKYVTSPSRKLPAIMNLYEWAGRNFSFLETLLVPEQGTKLRCQTFQAGSFNHYTKTPRKCIEIIFLLYSSYQTEKVQSL